MSHTIYQVVRTGQNISL